MYLMDMFDNQYLLLWRERERERERESILNCLDITQYLISRYCIRVAVGKEFQFPSPSPSHSHRVSVGIPTCFPMGIPMGNSHVGILCGFHMANPPSKSYENSKSYWILL